MAEERIARSSFMDNTELEFNNRQNFIRFRDNPKVYELQDDNLPS